MEKMVDSNEINQLAQLARINIKPELVDELAGNISQILSLVDQLQAVDTEGVEPMSHPMDAIQTLRADVITESNKREQLQAPAPAVEKGLFLVPQVID